MADDPNSYNFNGNDYEFTIRVFNGVNDIYLKPEAWDDLIFEEDIFDWFTTGSITIKTPYDTFERASDDAQSQLAGNEKLVYKFRNDGRDTIYITIMPKAGDVEGMTEDYPEKQWRIELECAIYDVEDLNHGNYSNKMKKLYFWEKTYQMMREKSIEFSTALVGTNKDKDGIEYMSNDDRGLPTGEALGELLYNDDDFKKHAENYKAEKDWNKGDPTNKFFYTSPTNYRFIDDLTTLLDGHTAEKDADYQPCILKFERPEAKGKPRQFSLMSIKDYFEKAGKSESSPGDYQIEHLKLEEYDEGNAIPITVKKAPLSDSTALDKDIKADNFTKLKSFQLVDFSGAAAAAYLQNTFVTSCNAEAGQFNIEIKEHKSEKFKDFAQKNIYGQVMTNESLERLPLTKYMESGYNSKYMYSNRQNEFARLADGRNVMLKRYLFNNLGMSFTRQGMTIRQPGRFFGVSKESQNDKEYDDKLEGQYFILNVVHHFSTSNRNYNTTVLGVKVHTFGEKTKFKADDLIIVGGDSAPTNQNPASTPNPVAAPSPNVPTQTEPVTIEGGGFEPPDMAPILELERQQQNAIPINARPTPSGNDYTNPLPSPSPQRAPIDSNTYLPSGDRPDNLLNPLLPPIAGQ